MQQAGELQTSAILEAPSHEKEHALVPPRPVSVSDGGFTFSSQLLQMFPQLQHSQLLNITRHKEIYLELTSAPIHYGSDVRTGRDVLIYDISLSCGGVDVATTEFLNLVDQLCCYISLTTPPPQLDASRPYDPQIKAISTASDLSVCALDTRENSSSSITMFKDALEPSTTGKSDRPVTNTQTSTSVSVSGASRTAFTAGLTSDPVEPAHALSTQTGTAKDTGSDHGASDGFSYIKDRKAIVYIKPWNDAKTQKNIQIKLFPKLFSRHFLKILHAYINLRDKKLIIITENFQGLFLSSLLAKIRTNSQSTRRLHDTLVHTYCCNLIDSLLYISQHRINLRGLDPRCIVADTQQCILRLFPSAFLMSVTRTDEMIYRHPSELYMSFFTGLGLSPRDFFLYKSYIGQALAYWLSKYNEFLTLEKNVRLSNTSVDHRQRECRDSQSISQENINGLFYHIYSENFDDTEEYPSYLSVSMGYRAIGDTPVDIQGTGLPQGGGSGVPVSSSSSGKLIWTGSTETISCADINRGSTNLDPGIFASSTPGQMGNVYRGTSVPNFLTVDKFSTASTSIAPLDVNARAKQQGPASMHTCTTNFNCPCVLYLFMKRLLVLSTVYMPLFLKHLTATIREQFEADISCPPRIGTQAPRDTSLFKLLLDFVGFPIENQRFQENEKAEHEYIVSPHCSKCCKVLRGMTTRFRPANELLVASMDCASQGYTSYSRVPSSQQCRMERSASGNLQNAQVPYHYLNFPLDETGADCIGSHFSNKRASGKHSKHRLSKMMKKIGIAADNEPYIDGHSISSIVANAKSPQDCECDQDLSHNFNAQHIPSTKGSPATRAAYSAEQSGQVSIHNQMNENHNQVMSSDNYQNGYDAGRTVLDLCVSSSNVSQEFSESLETDVVPDHVDDIDELSMINFNVTNPAARYIYSLGLVMLCIAIGTDPWTQEGYLIDGILSDKLPSSLISVQNKDFCELITKCIDRSNYFGSVEAILEHKYFKEHLNLLQHQQPRDSVSSQDYLAYANSHEREGGPTKTGCGAAGMGAGASNPFKMTHGHVKEDDAQAVNTFSTVSAIDYACVNSGRSSIGRISTTDSAPHTEGSAADCLSEQEINEPRSPTLISAANTKVELIDGQFSRAYIGTPIDAMKTPKVPITRDDNVSPLVASIHHQAPALNTVNTGAMPPHAQIVTPNSKQSLTPIHTSEHTGTDDSLPMLSQQASESKLPCAPLESCTPINMPIYPVYQGVELLTLRKDTATLAVIYLADGNIKKKITHSIASDEEPSNIYLEMVNKMKSMQLELHQMKNLEADIEDLLTKEFYHPTD